MHTHAERKTLSYRQSARGAAALYASLEMFCLPFPRQQIPLRKRSPDNDEIARKAPHVRHLAEQDGPEDRRIDDLRIIKHRDVPRRRVLISGRDRQLCAGGGTTGKDKEKQLLQCHRTIVQQQVGKKNDC